MLKMPSITTYDRVRSWSFETALPFWSMAGVDDIHGGFVEALAFDGTDAEVPFKRTRVTCRQVYVFAQAKLLGWETGTASRLINLGTDYLITKAWLGHDKGFARCLTRAGEILDPTPDLYDHAFALFAFAWGHRATGDTDYLIWAHRTLDFVETHLSHCDNTSFLHQTLAKGWRLQNPHMHLLEAALAAFETSGDDRFAALAHKLAALFSEKFFDPRQGTLGEYFQQDWSPAPDEKGNLIEPGHHFEWAWLLHQCQRLLGLDFNDTTRALVNFAEKHGVDPNSGAVFNIVQKNGAPVDQGSRTWPNTERIKAAVALYEQDGADPHPVFQSSTDLLFNQYLMSKPGRNIPAGAWHDAYDRDGQVTSVNIPASTFYHLFLAFAEMLRVEKK